MTEATVKKIPNLWSRLTAKVAADAGAALAQTLAHRYPPELEQDGKLRTSADRLSRVLEGLYAECKRDLGGNRPGLLARARLANAFKWGLIERGYSKAFIDVATEGLVVSLSKPAASAPELERAERKRARKAERIRERASGDAPPRG